LARARQRGGNSRRNNRRVKRNGPSVEDARAVGAVLRRGAPGTISELNTVFARAINFKLSTLCIKCQRKRGA
jgi:hypothetical protein